MLGFGVIHSFIHSCFSHFSIIVLVDQVRPLVKLPRECRNIKTRLFFFSPGSQWPFHRRSGLIAATQSHRRCSVPHVASDTLLIAGQAFYWNRIILRFRPVRFVLIHDKQQQQPPQQNSRKPLPKRCVPSVLAHTYAPITIIRRHTGKAAVSESSAGQAAPQQRRGGCRRERTDGRPSLISSTAS